MFAGLRSVDDVLLVRGVDRVDDLNGQAQPLVERQRAAGDALGERAALDQFEDEERLDVRLLDAVDRLYT